MLNAEIDLKKVNADNAVYQVLAVVFGIMGVIYFIVGICMLAAYNFSLDERTTGDVFVFFILGIVFSALGVICIILTAVLFGVMLRRTKHMREIVSEGNYIMAEIMSVDSDYSVTINGRYAQRLYCRYTDEAGVIHEFRSRRFFFDPSDLLTELEIPVYFRRGDYEHYYVDIDSFRQSAPQIERHY